MSDRFRTTRWSLVLAARDGPRSEAREALGQLCETYWYPLYAFVRRRGHDADEAADLTQAYFVQLMDKDYLRGVRPEAGRFRSFLLASVKNFLSKHRERTRALKRGGGAVVLSLDAMTAERRYREEPATDATAESLFERRWALTVLDRAMDRLKHEFESSGRAALFAELRDCITGGTPERPYAGIAADLNMRESAVKVTVHRARRRLGELLRAEIAETVASADDIDGEVRHLLTCLRAGRSDAVM